MTEADQEIGDDTEPEDPVEQRPELAGNEIGRLDADHEAQESENDRQADQPRRLVRLSGTPLTGDKGHREPQGGRGNPLGHARGSERQAGVLGGVGSVAGTASRARGDCSLAGDQEGGEGGTPGQDGEAWSKGDGDERQDRHDWSLEEWRMV
jgi:hypothetical protein